MGGLLPQRGRRRGRLALALTLVMAIVGLACSDDGASDGDADGQESTSTGEQTFTGEPVKILVPGSFSDPVSGFSTPEFAGAAEARAQVINEQGGIEDASGETHELEVIICDTQVDINKTADCAREAVSEDVAAVVGYNAPLGFVMLPILEEAGIPLIGPFGGGVETATSPVSFPISSGGLGAFPGLPLILADEGAETQTYSRINYGNDDSTLVFVENSASQEDVELTVTPLIPPDQADMAPSAAAATRGDPEGASFFMFGQPVGNFVQAVAQTGYDGEVATITAAVNDQLLETLGPAAEGLLLVGSSRYLPTTEGGRMYTDEMAAFDESLPTSDGSALYWLATYVFGEVASTLETIDAASMLDAMGSLHDFDMLGMTPPLSTDVEFTGDSPVPLPRLYNSAITYFVVEDGMITELDDEFHYPFGEPDNAGG